VFFPVSAVLVETSTQGPAGAIASLGDLTGRRDVVGGLEAMAGDHGFCFKVLIPGDAFALPAAVFREAVWKQPSLMEHLFRRANLRIAIAATKARAALNRRSDVRLAHLILELHHLSSLTGIRLTQAQIGQLLGVRRSTINWAARTLSGAGAIQYSRGRIRIEDVEELKRFAEAAA